MSYVAQLLPDLEEARALRDAMLVSLGVKELRPLSQSEQDALWALLTKLTADMRRRS